MQQIQSIIDSLTSGVIAIDIQGTITVINDAAARLLGVSKEYTVGRPLLSVVPNSGLVNVLLTGKPEVGRPQVIGERTVIANRSPVFVKDTVVGAVSLFQDITEMEKISRELDSTKALVQTLETVLTGAGEWIVVVDFSGIITMISEEYAAFNGMTAEQAIGKHVTEVIENTRMHVVAQTGVAEMGEAQTIKGRELIVNRIPINVGGRVLGAYGRVVFKSVDQLWELAAKLKLLESKVYYYERELNKLRGARYSFSSIIGSGPAITAAKAEAFRAALTDSTVLLLGETGTGKELFAHAVHSAGHRRNGPFIKVNCAAVPSELLESELFGYEEGAFTGARKGGKPGKFELATGGTLFLDEIGDMPLAMQAKLLRAIQEREVERVGGTVTRRIDIRIIAATAQPLEDLVEQGKFRADLYYRIHVIPIRLPNLRECSEDIQTIAENFLIQHASETGEPKLLAPEVLKFLTCYSWPGNIRELQNVLERAVTMSRGDVILPEHVPPHLLLRNIKPKDLPAVHPQRSMPGDAGAESKISGLKRLREHSEKDALIQAIRASNFNKTKAAQLLGIHRTALYKRLRKYNISPQLN